MTTGLVLFVGGPHGGERGYLEIRDSLEVEQTEAPDHESLPDYLYDRDRDVWTCVYTRRRNIVGDTVLYAPANWTNLDVLAELIKGYRV